MNALEHTVSPVPQRWVGPLNFPPGHWKKQLPGKYRQIAVRGDINALQTLLTEHPEFLNKRGSHNRTFLWEATRKGRFEMVQWLVAQGAELDAIGCYNGESYVQLTPYCAAIYYRRSETAAYLHSLNPTLDIFRAAFLGDQQRVADMLKADSTLLNAEDPHDDLYFVPLLAFPIVGEDANMVKFLLEQGASVPPYSAQLLYLAAAASRMDLVEMLIACGAQVSALDTGTYVNITDLSIMQFLLDRGASATQAGRNGFPPLVFLARGDKGEHPEKLQLLLDHGAVVDARGPKGRTALHHAAASGYEQVVRLLLERGANATLRDHEGETALSQALAAGKNAVVELLRGAG